MNEVKIIPVKGLPEIKPGDDLAELTFKSLTENKTEVLSNDVFIFTQKIVSKSEGMAKNLNEISFEELLESQTKYVIRKRGDLVISKTKHGFICANAGIDKSNVEEEHFEKIAQKQGRKAQVQAYTKQVTANLAFPELVTGSTVEEINNSLKQQVEREAKLTSKGAKENLEEILKSNPSWARTINPSANIESSSTLLDGSYKDKRNMMLDTLKDKRKFQSELDKLKRSVLDNGFGPNFRR